VKERAREGETKGCAGTQREQEREGQRETDVLRHVSVLSIVFPAVPMYEGAP